MRIKRLAAAIAAASAVALTGAVVAVATHPVVVPKFAFSVNPTTAGSVTDTAAELAISDAGDPPANLRLHLDPGHLIAYADDFASPVQPPPGNGDTVGALKLSIDPAGDGCGNPIAVSGDLVWVEPIGAGAPAGTVAEVKFTSTGVFAPFTRAFVVKSAGDAQQRARHHDLVVPRFGVPALCHVSRIELAQVTFGYARTLYPTFAPVIVQRNPGTAGQKVVYLDYRTRSGASRVFKAPYTVTP